MKLRRLAIRVQTPDGTYGTNVDFPDGLVVVWADNSMGKSTCVKSILIALGMEAMLTTSRADLPVTPAMKVRLDSDNGELDVLQSEVFLEIENRDGKRIVVQRSIKGSRDPNLITVHAGPALTVPRVAAPTTDYFVNRDGAASREAGFHYYLTKFLGWELPTVQTFDGSEYPLYLQCIFPYLVVEQTRGWSTIQPPLPTQFRIRDAHRRTVEFLLNLDAHKIALRRQEVQFEKTRIESDWASQVAQVKEVADTIGGTAQSLPASPLMSWPPEVPPVLVLPIANAWLTVNQVVEAEKSELSRLVEEEIPRVQEIAVASQQDLLSAEEESRDRQALLSRLLDALEEEQEEVKRLTVRLQGIDEDIQRNKDTRTLKKMGSRQSSEVDSGNCPVCHQAIEDSLMPLDAQQGVMTLDQNIEFLGEQKRTFELMLANARRIADARLTQTRSVNDELNSLRANIRALRQTLNSDGRLPSIAALRSRIEFEGRVQRHEASAAQFSKLIARFGALAERWRQNQNEWKSLPKDDTTTNDKEKIQTWTEVVRSQLTQYGFGSFSPNQVVVSPDTYRPEHEGFDLEASLVQGFVLQTSISASDLIRTIWSYLNGMLELARIAPTNHPGFIIFDEPRQQSAKDVSFGQLLNRASTSAAAKQQVIVFTSEDLGRLKGHLATIPHTLRPIDGRVIKKLQ